MGKVTKDMTISNVLQMDRVQHPYLLTMGCTAWVVRHLQGKH